jgi:hypothetical protein
MVFPIIIHHTVAKTPIVLIFSHGHAEGQTLKRNKILSYQKALDASKYRYTWGYQECYSSRADGGSKEVADTAQKLVAKDCYANRYSPKLA